MSPAETTDGTRRTTSLGALAQSLLHEPISDDGAPGERWAYPPVDRFLVSLFLAFLLSRPLTDGQLKRAAEAARA